MFLSFAAASATHIRFEALGLHPDIVTINPFHVLGHAIGPLSLRWYSLAYITGIVVGWWYLLRLLREPGAPMARRHADDLVFYATLGILLGGRIGYILFYGQTMWRQPTEWFKLWDGGMSFHGGLVGLMLGIWFLARQNNLPVLRLFDYVGCVAAIGEFVGRLANFVNGELWGRPSDVPWAIVFPHTVAYGLDPARHPSQLYEALGEGLLPFILLAFLFYRTRARYQPGMLAGVGLLQFSVSRFIIEFFREPDAQLRGFAAQTGLNMGQWLCLPMIAGGTYLIITAPARRRRVEPVAGTASVA